MENPPCDPASNPHGKGLMTRHGRWVSFVGMDGAGKTRISGEVKELLEQQGLRVALIYGGRGKANVLPVDLIRRRRGKQKVPSEEHASTAHGGKQPSGLKRRRRQAQAVFTAGVFFVDQILKYIVQIRPLRKSHDVVLMDRDATDLLLMADVPMALKRCLYGLVPHPSLVIYLYHDLKTLSQRKARHPVEDLRRQQRLFHDILPFLDPLRIRSDDVHQTAETLVSHVLSRA